MSHKSFSEDQIRKMFDKELIDEMIAKRRLLLIKIQIKKKTNCYLMHLNCPSQVLRKSDEYDDDGEYITLSDKTKWRKIPRFTS